MAVYSHIVDLVFGMGILMLLLVLGLMKRTRGRIGGKVDEEVTGKG